MLPNMFRNPGCGMNAGAAAPHAAKQPEVRDFVADVAAEVLADEDRGGLAGRPPSPGSQAA